MINIWQFQSGDKVEAVDTKGRVFRGRVAAIWDTEELEEDEDCIDIQVTGEYIVGLHPSEIATIQKV